ncbi:MAG: twin-arginine translocation signal domain-containing protein, partial [Hypericibacter sp.]
MKISSTHRLERLQDRYANGGMDRRTFLGLTAAAAASMGVMTGWGRNALAAVTEVRFDGWGGVVQ